MSPAIDYSTQQKYGYISSKKQGYGPTHFAQQPTQTGARTFVVIVEDEPENELDGIDIPESKFQDESRRMLFVRKVLGAVGLQFLVCTCFIALCQFESNTNAFFRDDIGRIVGILCSISWFALFIAVACCNVGYGKPNRSNISLMIISTILLSTFAGAYTVGFDLPSIMIAAGTTVGVILVLSLISFNTKFDITNKGWWIFGAVLALIIFSSIASILFLTGVLSIQDKIFISLTLSGFSAMLFAVMILYQLQLIVGGGKYKYGEDDWLIASITLFYDIVVFFLDMLQITRLMR